MRISGIGGITNGCIVGISVLIFGIVGSWTFGIGAVPPGGIDGRGSFDGTFFGLGNGFEESGGIFGLVSRVGSGLIRVLGSVGTLLLGTSRFGVGLVYC